MLNGSKERRGDDVKIMKDSYTEKKVAYISYQEALILFYIRAKTICRDAIRFGSQRLMSLEGLKYLWREQSSIENP